MKKSVSILLITALSLGCLAGCGNNSNKTTANSTVKNDEDTVAESVEEEDNELSFDYDIKKNDYSVKDDNGNLVCDYHYDLVVFEDDRLDKLNQILEGKLESYKEEVKSTKEDYVDPDLESGYLTTEYPYEDSYTFGNLYHNDQFISLYNTSAWYMGGVGGADKDIVNYDVINDSVPTIADVLNIDDADACALAKEKTYAYFGENQPMSISFIEDYDVAQFNYYLTDDGIYLYYAKYEIGSGADGDFDILLKSWDGDDPDTTANNEERTSNAALPDGHYVSSLSSEESPYSGGMVQSLSVAGNTVTITASFDRYENVENYYDTESDHYTSATYQLELADTASFSDYAEKEFPMTKDEFFSSVSEMMGGGLGFEFIIENGKIVKMSINS